MPEKCRGQDSKRIFYWIFREIARAFEIPISTLLLRASPDMNLGFEKSANVLLVGKKTLGEIRGNTDAVFYYKDSSRTSICWSISS